MPIGNGPDYYNGINREEDKLVKLGDEIQEWWDNLNESFKFELMDIEYPDHSHLLNIEGMWEGLDWETQLEIYKRENGYEDI